MVDFKEFGAYMGNVLGRVMVEHERVTSAQLTAIMDGMIEALEQQAADDARIQDLLAYLEFAKVYVLHEVSGNPSPRAVLAGSKAILVLDEPAVHEAERVLCQAAIERASNLAEAASVLGISRHALRRRCIKYRLAVPSRAGEAK